MGHSSSIDTKRLHRCHWCANEACGYRGRRRTVEGGCPKYEYLDPALRPRKWENMDGTNRRRIRRRAKAHLSSENVDFIIERVLPSDPKKYQGYFTRGLHECVDGCLERLGGRIPVIPPRERGQFSLVHKDLVLLPEAWEAVDRIVAYWKETNGQCSRARVVDYFVTLMRLADELVREGGGEGGSGNGNQP